MLKVVVNSPTSIPQLTNNKRLPTIAIIACCCFASCNLLRYLVDLRTAAICCGAGGRLSTDGDCIVNLLSGIMYVIQQRKQSPAIRSSRISTQSYSHSRVCIVVVIVAVTVVVVVLVIVVVSGPVVVVSGVAVAVAVPSSLHQCCDFVHCPCTCQHSNQCQLLESCPSHIRLDMLTSINVYVAASLARGSCQAVPVQSAPAHLAQ